MIKKVTLNWYGQLHEFYTDAKTNDKAIANVLNRFAAIMKYTSYHVRQYYSTRSNAIKVEE